MSRKASSLNLSSFSAEQTLSALSCWRWRWWPIRLLNGYRLAFVVSLRVSGKLAASKPASTKAGRSGEGGEGELATTDGKLTGRSQAGNRAGRCLIHLFLRCLTLSFGGFGEGGRQADTSLWMNSLTEREIGSGSLSLCFASSCSLFSFLFSNGEKRKKDDTGSSAARAAALLLGRSVSLSGSLSRQPARQRAVELPCGRAAQRRSPGLPARRPALQSLV